MPARISRSRSRASTTLCAFARASVPLTLQPMIDVHQSHSSWTRDAKRAIKSGARYLLGPVRLDRNDRSADALRMSPTSTASPASRALGSGSATSSRPSIASGDATDLAGSCASTRTSRASSDRSRRSRACAQADDQTDASPGTTSPTCASSARTARVRRCAGRARADLLADCRIAGYGTSQLLRATLTASGAHIYTKNGRSMSTNLSKLRVRGHKPSSSLTAQEYLRECNKATGGAKLYVTGASTRCQGAADGDRVRLAVQLGLGQGQVDQGGASTRRLTRSDAPGDEGLPQHQSVRLPFARSDATQRASPARLRSRTCAAEVRSARLIRG